MEYRFLWFVSTCNNDFEANSTSLMSLWANIKFFPEPTGELYGWLLATLVKAYDNIFLIPFTILQMKFDQNAVNSSLLHATHFDR